MLIIDHSKVNSSDRRLTSLQGRAHCVLHYLS